MNTLISIIMAAFNAEEFIGEAIQSVIAQSHAEWELLIVNDGSTDATADIIQSYAEPRIRYIEQDNGGVSSARNLALEHMQGDYFCFLDADDILPINALSSRLAMFAQAPQVMAVDGAVAVMDSLRKMQIDSYHPLPCEDIITSLCSLSGDNFFGPNWMFRRNRNKNYAFDTNITHGEDLLFYIENIDHGKYSCTKEVVLHYRRGNKSAMNNLQGLEAGYRYIGTKLTQLPHISLSDAQVFQRKSRSIMFKSYLGNFNPLDAIRVWLTW